METESLRRSGKDATLAHVEMKQSKKVNGMGLRRLIIRIFYQSNKSRRTV